ncbi:MAG: HD-GYP domain-containing protein, partial [Chloroflexia bacterium]
DFDTAVAALRPTSHGASPPCIRRGAVGLRPHLAGLLHDIGKIGIRDAILYKPGPLDEEEYRRVQEHPVLAAQILSPIPGLRKVVPIVLHHHERYDGSGYPDRLAGEAIPVGARILAVVDAFEAMTSVRAYRPAFTPKEALEKLVRGRGSQFDPALVDLWTRLVQAGRLTLPESAPGPDVSPQDGRGRLSW